MVTSARSPEAGSKARDSDVMLAADSARPFRKFGELSGKEAPWPNNC
jgi:hypothetical protein